MAILPEAIVQGGKYITEENSLGHSQIKEVLKVLPDKQDPLRDVIEYSSKVFGSNAPWVKHKCLRKTFANSIASSVDARVTA
jgi:hypothetical protein